MKKVLQPQTGTAFELKKDETLIIRDPQGEQVCDLFCVDQLNMRDGFSSGRTIDTNDSIHLKVGQFLYSNEGKPLLQILQDTCGKHDLLLTPCSLQMFQMIHNNNDYHPSCLENLEKSLAAFDIPRFQITSTFNIFMNVEVEKGGHIKMHAPSSKYGDFIKLQASRDLIVGITACSDESTNNGVCKPIEYEIDGMDF